ncbi:hypothetical protein [Rhodopila sp.]|uniref:hypothetical protein n=1 Tax=Rhodopila sp. TaxID=2480087 RepID=UPI003D10FB11
MKAEADDFSREQKFGLGFGLIGGKHVVGGVACGGQVAVGTGKEKQREAPEDGVLDGEWDVGQGEHAGASGGSWLFCRIIGMKSLFRKYFFLIRDDPMLSLAASAGTAAGVSCAPVF